MRTSESTTELFDALVKAQLVLVNPTKDKTASVKSRTGTSYAYQYVGLDTITAEVRPVLHAHGLVVLQEASSANGWAAITTRIVHESGQYVEFEPLTLPAGDDAQSLGSAITYGRRYALCAALGIAADEDDDGAKATKSKWQSKAPVPRAAAAVSTPAAENADTRTATGDTVGGGDRMGKATPPPPDLAPDDLKGHFGSYAAALVSARNRFGEDIKKVDDLTPEQVLELCAAVS